MIYDPDRTKIVLRYLADDGQPELPRLPYINGQVIYTAVRELREDSLSDEAKRARRRWQIWYFISRVALVVGLTLLVIIAYALVLRYGGQGGS